MIQRFLNSKTKTITFAALILALSTGISRLLGLLRDRLLAGKFGAGEELDIYFAAFRIPDFVYGILIMGAISAAFLPVFSDYFKGKDGRWNDESLKFVNNVLNCFFVMLVFLSVFLFIFTPWLIKLIIPGFSFENTQITIALTRLMFLSPILFGISSIFSGILHYFNRFLVYSLAPILYNLGIILGILFLAPRFGIFGVAYGVILGAFLHMLIQIPAAINCGFKYGGYCNFFDPGVKRIFKLMIPRIIGSTAYHINLVVITAIASTLAIGSITVFNFSNNLQHLPIGIIGISYAVSVFPTLSRYWSKGEKSEFLKSFSSGIRQVLLFIVPLCFLIFLLRAQIVRLVLGTGEFNWVETRLTAASLGLFCIGIFASSLTPIIIRAFFAFQDTRTPVLISVLSMISNVLLSFFFVYIFAFGNVFRNFFSEFLIVDDISDIRIIGLALAFSLAAFVQLILLLVFLYKKIGNFRIKEIFNSFAKIAIASIFMSVFAYIVRQIIIEYVNMEKFWGLLVQGFVVSLVAVVIYLLVLFLLKSEEIKNIKDSLFHGSN